MTLNASKLGGGDRPKQPMLEVGSYPARLAGVTTLGVQTQRPFKGEAKPPKLEVMFTYELLDAFMKDEAGEDIEDKPRWITERMAFSPLRAERGKSTIRYRAIDPTGAADGDWEKLLGAPCMVTVAINQWKDKNTGEKREKEVVAEVVAMRDRDAKRAPQLQNDPRVFDFYNPDMETYEKLPDWIKEVMTKALDYRGSALQRILDGGVEAEDPDGDEETYEVDETIGSDEDDSVEKW